MESWLVGKAKESTDGFAAESWMLVARTISSQTGSFDANVATYDIYCAKKQINEAAESLQQLYMNFSTEPRFWKEVRSLVEAIDSDRSDESTRFKKDVFKKLLPEMRQSLLIDLADQASDPAEKCRHYLLLIKLFPEGDCILAVGIELIRMLRELKDEESESVDPCNSWFWKTLICEALPTLMKRKSLPIPDQLCLDLLKETLQFFASFTNAKDELLPKRSERLDGFASCCKDPWNFFVKILYSTADRLEWRKMKQIYEFRTSSAEKILKSLGKSSGQDAMEKLHLSMAHLVWISSVYKSLLGSSASEAVLVLSPPPLTLTPERKKCSVGGFSPSALFPPEKLDSLRSTLRLACMCWDLLEPNLPVLFDTFSVKRMPWIVGVLKDAFLFSNRFQDALHLISRFLSDSPKEAFALHLQSASCHLGLGSLKEACLDVMTAAEALPTHSIQSDSTSQMGQLQSSQAQLMFLPRSQTMFFVSHLLLHVLCPKLAGKSPKDVVIGQAIILSQMDFGAYRHIFRKCLEAIRARGSFHYQGLFNYVNHLEILEEFAFLNALKGELTLDLLDNESIRKSGASTRFSVKEAKDELRQVLENQVGQLIPDTSSVLIRRFIAERKESLTTFD